MMLDDHLIVQITSLTIHPTDKALLYVNTYSP